MVYAYLKEGADDDVCEQQIEQIKSFARKKGLSVDFILTGNGINVSSSSDRKTESLFNKVKARGDILIVPNVTCLGNDIIEVLTNLQKLLESGVIFYSVEEGYALDNCENNKIISEVFGMASEIQKGLLSDNETDQ